MKAWAIGVLLFMATSFASTAQNPPEPAKSDNGGLHLCGGNLTNAPCSQVVPGMSDDQAKPLPPGYLKAMEAESKERVDAMRQHEQSMRAGNAIKNGRVSLATFTPKGMRQRNVDWRPAGRDDAGSAYFYTINADSFQVHAFVKTAPTLLDGSIGDITVSEWRFQCRPDGTPANHANFYGAAKFYATTGEWAGQAPIPEGVPTELRPGTVIGSIVTKSCRAVADAHGYIAS